MISWLFWTGRRFAVVSIATVVLLVSTAVVVANLRLGGEAPASRLAAEQDAAPTEFPEPEPVRVADPIPLAEKATQSFLSETGDPAVVTGPHAVVKQNDYLTEVRVNTTGGIVIVDVTPDGPRWAVLSASWADR